MTCIKNVIIFFLLLLAGNRLIADELWFMGDDRFHNYFESEEYFRIEQDYTRYNKGCLRVDNRVKDGNFSEYKILTAVIDRDSTLVYWSNRLLPNYLYPHPKAKAPVVLSLEKKWKELAVGLEHIVAIKSDGTLWSVGRNEYGQLGNGNKENSFELVQIGFDKDWKEISCGDYHTIALKKDGTLWAWGLNSQWQLGDSNFASSSVPIQISKEKWVKISAGANHSFAINADGSLWSWGTNVLGALGLQNRQFAKVPTKIALEHKFIDISSKYEHSLALTEDNRVFGSGWNYYYQVGQSNIIESTFKEFIMSTKVKAVFTTHHNSLIIDTTGRIYINGCIVGIKGYEGAGVLYNFVRLNNLKNWKYVVGGVHYFYAVKDGYDLVADAKAFEDTLCAGDSTVINVTFKSGNPPYTFKWQPDYSLDFPDLQNPTVYPKVSTTYTLLITDSKDESATFSVPIKVYNKPFLRVEYNKHSCQNEIFYANARGASSYKWYKDSIHSDNLISISENLNYVLENDTKFIIVGSNFKCIDIDTINVNAIAKPISNIGSKGSLSLCIGDTTKLFINNKDKNYTYDWLANGFSYNADTLYVTKPGIYKLYERNNKNSNCMDIDSIEIKEQIKDKITIIQSEPLCNESFIKLSLSAFYQGVDFLWSNGVVANEIYVSKEGVYWCKSINNNCLQADSIALMNYPVSNVQIIGENKLCDNSSSTLSINGSYVSCTWSNGSNESNIMVNQIGNYSVTTTNLYGCKATATHNIIGNYNDIDYNNLKEIDFGTLTLYKQITKNLSLPTSLQFKCKIYSGTLYKFQQNGNEIAVTYNSSKFGLNTDTLYLEVEHPCKEVVPIILKGQTEGEQIIRIKVADIVTKPGLENVSLPINYELNKYIETPTSITWSAKLSYPVRLYKSYLTNNVVGNNEKEIILKGESVITNSSGMLSNILGNTYIANLNETIVKIDEFIITPKYKVILEDGSIRLGDICAVLLRGIQLFNPIVLSINPNPSRENLNLSIKGDLKGEFVVAFSNSNGELSYSTVLKKTKDVESYQLESPLSSGFYNIQLYYEGNVILQQNLMVE